MPNAQRINYGIDAPTAIRNIAVIGVVLLLIAFSGHAQIPVGSGNYILHNKSLPPLSFCF